MEIRDYINVVRRGWAIILVATLLGAGSAALYTFTRTPLYESRSKVFVSVQSAANIQDLSQSNSFTQQAVQDYAEVAVTPIVLDTVIEKLGLPTTSSELAKSISANAPLQSVVLTISVRDQSADLAMRIANEVSARLSGVAGELTTTVSGASPVKITLIEPATASSTPATPNVPLNLGLGTLAGLLIGLAGAAITVSFKSPSRRGTRAG